MLVYPDYYPDFSCTASQCRHNCCIGWEIDIDSESLSKYRQTKGPMGQRLSAAISDGEDPHFILGKGERCPFLNEHNLCDLIRYGGEKFLCQICTDHPRFRNFLPGRTEIGVGLCCEAAAALILSRTDPVRLIASSEEEDVGEQTQILLAVRERLLELAQDRSRSLAQREKALLDYVQLSLPDRSPGQWAAFYLGLERMDESWTSVLEALSVYGDSLTQKEVDSIINHFEIEYEQLLVYFLYRHILTAYEDGDVESKVSFAVLSVRFLVYLGALHVCQHGTFTRTDLVEYARLYSAEIEYSQENIDTLLDALTTPNFML